MSKRTIMSKPKRIPLPDGSFLVDPEPPAILDLPLDSGSGGARDVTDDEVRAMERAMDEYVQLRDHEARRALDASRGRTTTNRANASQGRKIDVDVVVEHDRLIAEGWKPTLADTEMEVRTGISARALAEARRKRVARRKRRA